MSYVGINIGAVSVKVVSIDGIQVSSRVVNHLGRAGEVLTEVLRDFPAAQAYGVCGHLGHISEVAATEAALRFIGGNYDAVASLGGESFAVYLLKGARILTALSHNQCAAGSGEFLIQQIGRLGLSLEEAIARSFDGHIVPLAARCSVHCKSDITHKLNRKEASLEDVLRTLHESMASKVVALLEKGQHPVANLLLIGGLAQNRALVSALESRLPGTRIHALPESAYFEALGAAVMTQAQPLYHQPHLEKKPPLAILPPLIQGQAQVNWMAEPPANKAIVGPFVLGVDAGSTTTKAVLLDPATGQLVASHYGRTEGDPVGATRQCLRAMVAQVGSCGVNLVATTGSARELIGAFLGTAHVYNEISAHATGATHLDPEVDTIFEIGGQDSKYILLRNGVPIDYAMNSACSAGTGSFLEECAQSDLGLPLAAITEAAMCARAPVVFKATCAAFINSDIRSALQEGYAREDVAAGLVYAIVQNYLTKVKGSRTVGRHVFLQGGVALNRAVACGFAQCLKKKVTVPAHPELLGAIGAALLAVQRSQGVVGNVTDLLQLAAPDLQELGHFRCASCGNHCTIDRFEVAGRRFPFGGRCTRFESVWKRADRLEEAVDLVEARNRLIFLPGSPAAGQKRIGIPRALTSHWLYPLFATFFTHLGMDVVLSQVDPAGWLKANSGFCFPVQIAHGAVLDLVKSGIKLVFLPQVSRMPNPLGARDSYLCPIAQASPYVIAKAFPEATILAPVLDFAGGYDSALGLIEMAESQLGVPRELAQEAYTAAVTAQLHAEESMLSLGQTALREALVDGRPALLLVGRSYNAFPPEASQSVARKLASMGVRVIPGDCLPQERIGPTSWHYPNLIMNAVALAKQHSNLFLLYVSSFSCTIDAFTHSFFASELGSKPYLMLEIDAHTADAGLQTRLEAFWDIIRNYHAPVATLSRFQAAAADGDGVVVTSAGQRIPFRDSRVKIYFPTFSHYHAQAVALAARWLGLNVGTPPKLSRRQLERGMQFSSGRECLPLPVCLGQMLEIHEKRQPGEVVGFYMVRGGAPCVVDCYLDYFRQFIRNNELRDLFIFDPLEGNDHYGLSVRKITQLASPVMTLADLFAEMEQVLGVAGPGDGADQLKACWERHVSSQPNLNALTANLQHLVDDVMAIPHRDPHGCAKVVVTGDFFLRFSPSFMEGVHQRYAQHGIILVPVGLNELLLYGAYSGMASTARSWSLPPDSAWAVAQACLRFFQPGARSYLTSWAQYHWLKSYDESYRRLFARTGLLIGAAHDVARLFAQAAEHLSPTIAGEAIPIVGKGVVASEEGYDGILAVGPFNCLPFRISEAILKPYSLQRYMPILTYESDGFSVHPAFLRQVDVHIQQVLAHRAAAK